MLKESISYFEELPIQLSLLSIGEYPVHRHDALELLYIVSGEIDVKSTFYHLTLKKGDFYLINSGDLHYLKERDEKNIVLMLHIDLDQFTEYHPYLDKAIFSCNTQDASPEEKIQLEEVTQRIIESYLEMRDKKQGYRKKVKSNIIHCLLTMINHFQYSCREDGNLKNNNVFRENDFQIQRFHRILDHIYENYDQKLTLESIAGQEYISKYYLTHLLKDGIGSGFQDLINLVRVEQSEKFLLGTKDSIENICYACGFSNPQYYVKNFIKFFGTTPLEHRKKYINKTIDYTTIRLYNFDEASIFMSNGTKEPELETSIQRFFLDLKKSPVKTTEQPIQKILLIPPMCVAKTATYHTQLTEILAQLGFSYLMIDFLDLIEAYELEQNWEFLELLLSIVSASLFKPILLISKTFPCEFHTDLKEKSFYDDVNNILEIHGISYEIKDKSLIDEETFVTQAMLIGENGFKKKAFYTFSLFSKLGNKVIEKSQDSIITKTENAYQILVENTFDNLSGYQKEFVFALTHLNHPYLIKQYTIPQSLKGEDELWQDLGMPSVLTKENRKLIQQIAMPSCTFSRIKPTPEHDLYITLKPSETLLIILEKCPY